MSVCPQHVSCPFYRSVEPSIVKRIRFASAYHYCRGGGASDCAIHRLLVSGARVPSDLQPGGERVPYGETSAPTAAVRALVVDNSPIFAMIAANAVEFHLPGAEVVTCHDFAEARRQLAAGDFSVVICGYGLGDGKTAHDLRTLSTAPMVLLTGRPESHVDRPPNAQVVQKGAGADALRSAIGACLAR